MTLDGMRIPRRMVKKTVQLGRSEGRGESYPEPYVELLSDARTKPADFLNILLEQWFNILMTDCKTHRSTPSYFADACHCICISSYSIFSLPRLFAPPKPTLQSRNLLSYNPRGSTNQCGADDYTLKKGAFIMAQIHIITANTTVETAAVKHSGAFVEEKKPTKVEKGAKEQDAKITQCAGEWTQAVAYIDDPQHQNMLVIRNVTSLEQAVDHARRCRADARNVTFYSNPVVACAPYIACG